MSVMNGYPDFQTVPQWRGAAILAQSYNVTIAAPLTKNAWLSNFSSLQIYCDAASNTGVVFNIDYYTDASLTFHIGNFAWQIWGAKMQAVVPILGPYAVFTVMTHNAGANTGVVYVAPTNVPVPKPQHPAGFTMLESQNLSVPANTTDQFLMADIMTGVAWLWAKALDASAKLQVIVKELDDTGAAVGTLIEADALTGIIGLQGLARERVVQLNIFNTDPVAAHPLAYRLALASQ